MTRIRRSRSASPYREGFTLIELLIVVAIIGIIAAILIPNLLDSLQKAKQKRAMTDMQLTGTALMAWLGDLGSAAAAGRGAAPSGLDWSSAFTTTSHEELQDILVPQYAQRIPPFDPWGSLYQFGLSEDPENSLLPFGMRSAGSDSEYESGSYPQGSFIATQYQRDIVWAGGYFVRWPGGLNSGS